MLDTYTQRHISIYISRFSWLAWWKGWRMDWQNDRSENLSELSATRPTLPANPGRFLFSLIPACVVWARLRFLLAHSF